MYSFTEENYLKAIYKLQEQSELAINTNAIATAIQTKAASVTDMVKKLSEKEGKKRQLNAGELREVMAVLKSVLKDNPELLKYLLP
jgi:DNA-binding MarR family transcriptional regulator